MVPLLAAWPLLAAAALGAGPKSMIKLAEICKVNISNWKL